MRTIEATESMAESSPNPSNERLPVTTPTTTAIPPRSPLRRMLITESVRARRSSRERSMSGEDTGRLDGLA